MKNIMHWFAPKGNELLILLAEQSSHALEAIKELKIFVSVYHDIGSKERKSMASLIKGIEKKADEVKRRIEHISKNQEGIGGISAILEDIVNLINSVASKLVILSIGRIDDYIANFIDLDVEIILEVNKIILNLNNPKEIENIFSKIKELENKADDIYQKALSELYHFYKNSIDIMKYREIYELLEQIADKCKDAAKLAKSAAAKRM